MRRFARSRLAWVLFGLSGLIPLLALLDSPPDPTLVIYSLFVLATCVRAWRRRAGVKTAPPLPGRGHPVGFWVTLLGAGYLTEVLAWTGEYLKCSESPALLHPQLLPDLIQATAFYSSWAIAWLLLRRWYRFSLGQAFAVQGLYGVLLEQQGGVFLAGLTTLPLGLVFWLFVFLVYGSTLGLAFGPYAADWSDPTRRGGAMRYLVALAVLLLVVFPVSAAWGALTQAIGLSPPPGPICERLLW
jgi:hypothetical protein